MLLSTDRIGFPKPLPELGVNLFRRNKAEVMHVVAGGDRVDPAEARVRQPAGEHQMTVEPMLARRYLREGHTHLKSDPRFFRQHGDGTAGGDGAAHCFEEGSNGWVLPAKVMLKVVASAGVRLVAVGEPSRAIWTGPERARLRCLRWRFHFWLPTVAQLESK